ncbi:MAG TPA: hypothetical protein PKC72_07575 [Chitinophagaceae bacterium]|nr:hypothetical protein [Chitinophagaceae bacterium]
MRTLFQTTIPLIFMISFTNAQLPTRTTTAKQTVSSRPFPGTTTFTPSPALQQAFNWWLAVKPTEFGVTYDKLPDRQSFYDSAIYKFYLMSSINFNGLPFSPGLVRLQPDSLFHLQAMPNLTSVFLSTNTCTHKTFQYLATLQNLNSVSFQFPSPSLPAGFTFDVTDKDLAALAQNTNLQYLQLGNCNLLSDKGLAVLNNNKKIKSLSLTDCNSLTDNFFLNLEGCSQLETLSFISRGNITSQAFKNLLSVMSTLSALRTINFRAGSTLSSGDLSNFITSCRQAGYNVVGYW